MKMRSIELVLVLMTLMSSISSVPVKKLALLSRHARSSDVNIIENCEQQIVSSGIYEFTSSTETAVCKLLILGPPDSVIRIDFHTFDIECEGDSFLGFLDGWEYYDQLLPGPWDSKRSLDDRRLGFCGSNYPKSPLMSAQNTAELMYQTPRSGGSFRIKVTFVTNPVPCSVLLTKPSGIHTIANHGKKSNCSVTIMEPTLVKVMSVDSGVAILPNRAPKNIAVSQKCQQRVGKNDMAEFLFGNNLEPGYLNYGGEICGQWATDAGTYSLPCATSVVRLQSSGAYYNSITFEYRAMTEAEMMHLVSQGVDLALIC